MKGTIVRTCFLLLKDMDTPTSFFFNLESAHTLSLYEKASSALLNCPKSQTLWVIHCNDKAMQGLPEGQRKNCEGVKEFIFVVKCGVAH